MAMYLHAGCTASHLNESCTALHLHMSCMVLYAQRAVVHVQRAAVCVQWAAMCIQCAAVCVQCALTVYACCAAACVQRVTKSAEMQTDTDLHARARTEHATAQTPVRRPLVHPPVPWLEHCCHQL